MRQTQRTLHQPSLPLGKHTLCNLFLQSKMTALSFDKSPPESLKTSIWRQSRQNKTNMYTSMALLIDKKLRIAMAKNG